MDTRNTPNGVTPKKSNTPTVKHLKEKCAFLGIPKSGNKMELRNKLRDHFKNSRFAHIRRFLPKGLPCPSDKEELIEQLVEVPELHVPETTPTPTSASTPAPIPTPPPKASRKSPEVEEICESEKKQVEGRARERAEQIKSTSTMTAKRKSPKKCSNCGGIGHNKRTCPETTVTVSLSQTPMTPPIYYSCLPDGCWAEETKVEESKTEEKGEESELEKFKSEIKSEIREEMKRELRDEMSKMKNTMREVMREIMREELSSVVRETFN